MEEDLYSIEYPDPIICTDVNGVKWERSGYCCQCGECCVGCHFTKKNDGYCMYLKWLSKDRGVCTGRHTDYNKNGCAHWPSQPWHIDHLPKCTYKFKKIG